MIDAIGSDLERIGVRFDVWFREHDLHDNGSYARAMATLAERGYTAERDGATWFTSTSLGDDKDNVLVRSTGKPTYFAADIAYHRDKFERRGFDRVIDLWGADHQGHVSRMKTVLQALGIDPQRLTIIISQLVTLKSGGDIVRASKRTGQIVTLADLVDEVGPDACRFFFLARAAESQMEFDLELAKKESNDNPVYYVQYAHARIAGILRQAAEQQATWEDGDVALLTDDAELALVRKMLQLPEIIDSIAVTLAPHSAAALRRRAGDCVPRVLRPLPRAHAGPVGGAGDEGAAKAGRGQQDSPRAHPSAHGHDRARRRCSALSRLCGGQRDGQQPGPPPTPPSRSLLVRTSICLRPLWPKSLLILTPS